MKKAFFSVAMFAATITVTSAALAQTVIDFADEATGDKPNGWSTAAAPDVTFTDTDGEGLYVGDFGSQSDGKALLVNPDDPRALQIDFAAPVSSISVAFGNDDDCCASAGDVALLTLTLGGVAVDEVSVALNLNDLMDQTISYSGSSFDRAVFMFADSGGDGIDLIEIVDNITFDNFQPAQPVPVQPVVALWLLAGLAGLMGIRQLRKAA